MGATASNEKAKGSRRSNGLAKFTGAWQGFVDLPLSREDKERLAALGEEDYPNVSEFLDRVLNDGYKFSVAVDEKHSCTITTLTGKSETCVNVGYSLSARGPDFPRSILALYYKHVILCEELRWSGHESNPKDQLSLWD